MLKKSLIIALMGAIAFPLAVRAETVMEKIARTGTLTVGTRTDAIPYSYVNDRGELVGYSIDMLEKIRSAIEAQLGKPITLQVVTLEGVDSAIGQLNSGGIDLACNTSFTWERDRFVDFSVSYGISGIRLLVPANSTLGTPESLAGKRVGVLQQNIAESTLKLVQPQAILVPFESVESGLQALTSQKVDAIAGDMVALAGIEQTLKPNTYKIVPNKAYANFGLACMFPPNNSSFADIVNYNLVKVMQGYVVGEPETVKMVDRWFGRNGIVPIDSELIKTFFDTIILTREQIPLSSPAVSE
jgi:polar amino acid transport system substrate-binding protein